MMSTPAPSTTPTDPPSPLGGWSEAIETLETPLVVPPEGRDMIQWGGVFNANGQYCHAASLWRRWRPILLEPEGGVPSAEDNLPGTWLWGGTLLNHFGHFLTESTVRLWALDHIPRPDGILFISKRGGRDLQPFHHSFFEALGIGDLPVRILRVPTTVERLFVPGQGFGIGPMSAGTAPFRHYFARNFCRDIAPEGGERLYISRSALGPGKGGILNETALEERLKQDGYEIYHPQQHSLQAQVARYRAARQVIALDGSALHLLAFAAREDIKVAMIRRRNSPVSKAISLHLEACLGGAPMVLDALQANWVRVDRKRVDRFSIGELNMPALGKALAEAGFVAQADGFASPSTTEIDALIEQLHTTTRHRFERLSFDVP